MPSRSVGVFPGEFERSIFTVGEDVLDLVRARPLIGMPSTGRFCGVLLFPKFKGPVARTDKAVAWNFRVRESDTGPAGVAIAVVVMSPPVVVSEEITSTSRIVLLVGVFKGSLDSRFSRGAGV